MSGLHRIERRIDQKLRQVLRSSSPNQRRELVEVHRGILDEVMSRVDTLSQGKLVFGYSHLDVRVLLAEPERRRSYELVFLEGDALSLDIKASLEERRVEFPPRLKVEVELVDSLSTDMGERGFEVSYSNAPDSPPSLHPVPVVLTVLAGNAGKDQYCLSKQRINIGRMAEVLDSELRIVRRNDLAFHDESTGPNSTVSRTHAHLEYDPEAARFRLFDDGSAQGTTVIRDGGVIAVPRGTSKGVLLQPGDEIIVGTVHILFEDTQS